MLADHTQANVTPDVSPTVPADPAATVPYRPTALVQRTAAGKSGSRRSWEQRRSVRYPCELDVRCHDEETHGEWSAKARNVSVSGIRLLTGKRVEPGTIFEMELPCRSREEPLRLVAQVVHLTPTQYGSWVLGCAFERRLNAEELQELIR
jgi:hypothetical protein